MEREDYVKEDHTRTEKKNKHVKRIVLQNAPDYKKWCPRREDDPACVHERLYQKKANLLYQYMTRAARILNCQRVTIVDMIGPTTCDETNFRSLFDNNDIHFRQNFAETLVQRVLSLL